MLISDGYAAWHSYPNYYYNFKERFLYDPDRGIHYRTVVSCEGAVAQEGKLVISSVKEATIRIVNSTSFAGFDRDPVKEGKEYKEAAIKNMALAMIKTGRPCASAMKMITRGFLTV